jgi:hypothetical protein
LSPSFLGQVFIIALFALALVALTLFVALVVVITALAVAIILVDCCVAFVVYSCPSLPEEDEAPTPLPCLCLGRVIVSLLPCGLIPPLVLCQ